MSKPELMLAKRAELDDFKDWSKDDWYNVIIEPKLDGVRLVRLPGGKWVSRNGKPYHNIEHITDLIDSLPNIDAYMVDGELQGGDWSRTVSYARTFKRKVGKLRYVIFDLVPVKGAILTPGLIDRRGMLGDLFSWHLPSEHIETIGINIVSSFAEFRQVFEDCVEDGCDGVIVKDKNGPYDFKRSKHWLKVKPHKELDCKIVGFNEGKGKYKGTLGSIEVVIPIKKRWSARSTSVSGMDDADRYYIWKHRDKLIGKFAEVKFRKISEKNRLIEPRLLRLRLDK